MKSSWFVVASHALALLSQSNEGYSSAYIAGSVNTNPAFLRRVLAVLGRANLVEAREGRDGGYRLSRPPGEIRLDEVYRVVRGEATAFELPHDTNPICPIGSGIPDAFVEIVDAVEAQIEHQLSQFTVAYLSDRSLALGVASSTG